MDYTWNPDMVLHIMDPWFEQLPCPGRILSKDGGALRCTRYRSDEYYVKARQLLAILSQKPPSHVSTKQLKTLAHFCLCVDHQHDEAIIARELENRLQEARRSYLCFEKVDTRFRAFRQNLCDKLSIDDDRSDASLLSTVQELASTISSRDRDIAGLRGKLWAEQNIQKAVDSEMKEQKKTVLSLGSRLKELKIELKDSKLQVEQLEQSLDESKGSVGRLEKSLESAGAKIRQLTESYEGSEARVRQQEAELSIMKSESADREMSNQELKISITNLQAQVEETKTLETALQYRVKELHQAISQTEAQALNILQSNANRQAQLTSTEQRLSEQIQALTTRHEQNFSAAEQLTTTTFELEKCQNELARATSTITSLELANATLHGHIEEGERARTVAEASKTWKARLRNFTQK